MRTYMNPWTIVWTLCLLSWTARARPVALDPPANAPTSQTINSGGSDSAVATTPGSAPTGDGTNRGDVGNGGGDNRPPNEINEPDWTAVVTAPVAGPNQDTDVQTPTPVTTNPGDPAQPGEPGNDVQPTDWFPPEAPTASPGGDDRVDRLRHYLEGRGCPPDVIERILSRYTGPRPYGTKAIATHRAWRGKGRKHTRTHRINKYKLSSHYSFESMESDESISACDFSGSFSDSYSNSFSESFSESFSHSKYRAKRSADASGESGMDGGHDASAVSGEGSHPSGESPGPGSVKSGEDGAGNSGESGEPGADKSGESGEPGIGNQDSDEGNESASNV